MGGSIGRLHVPLREPEDVIQHLGKQHKHWKEGRSAHALAHVWSKANELPARVASVLQSNPVFDDVTLVDAFLERQVDLETPGRASQTDLLAVVALKDSIAVVAVEGKAGEPFGPLVREWKDGSPGKKGRLEDLCQRLGLPAERADELRYQLLHRTVSALIEAKRYRTNIAVLLVHSFSDDEKGFDAFSDFLGVLGVPDVKRNALYRLADRDGCALYAGWIDDEAPVSQRPETYLESLREYAGRLKSRCDEMLAWCDERQSKLG